MIKLNDLLRLSNEEIEKAKIKFNIYNGYENPIELFKTTPDIINKQWLYWRNERRYFNVGEIAICLVRIFDDNWLLTTIDTVETELNVKAGINYTGKPIEKYQAFYGRTVLRFHKDFQPTVVSLPKVIDELEVSQILPDTFDDDFFPGYDRVRLSYAQLNNILIRGKKDWISALESQKAVYLITDTNNGKQYVGSATSNNGMLLQRWRNYISNGHGGNIELKRVVDENGFDYVKKFFQYSILENYNARIDDIVILERESWWKDILQTRKFGYNAN